jgi:hypothetical protein
MDAFGPLLSEIRLSQQRLLDLAADLSDDQLMWTPRPGVPSIGFHLWHIGRWNDVDRAEHGGGPQVWDTESIAKDWGLADSELGSHDAGTGLGDAATEGLALPSKETIEAYVSASFKAFDDWMQASSAANEEDSALYAVALGTLVHGNRHLGMIEALRGAMGLRGTATE